MYTLTVPYFFQPPTLVPRSRSSFPPYRKHGNYAHTAPQVNNAGVLGVTTDVGDPATLQETVNLSPIYMSHSLKIHFWSTLRSHLDTALLWTVWS